MLRLLIFAVALAAGGAAAWLALSIEQEDTTIVAAPAPTVPTVEVLVATVALARGTRLTPEQLAWRRWPEEAVVEGFLRREERPDALQSFEDWIVRVPIWEGEPVRLDRLSEGTSGVMALILDPGMRAMALRVAAESSAGGFILPNDRIDLIHTIQTDADGDGDEEPISRTIIRNVKVLAVDQLADDADDRGAVVGDTVTIALTPEQVEFVEMARNSGRVSLSLRSVADYGDTMVGDLDLLTLAPPKVPVEETVVLLEADRPGDDGREPDVDLSALGTMPGGVLAADLAAAVSVGRDAPPEPHSVRIIGSGRIEVINFDDREAGR